MELYCPLVQNEKATRLAVKHKHLFYDEVNPYFQQSFSMPLHGKQ